MDELATDRLMGDLPNNHGLIGDLSNDQGLTGDHGLMDDHPNDHGFIGDQGFQLSDDVIQQIQQIVNLSLVEMNWDEFTKFTEGHFINPQSSTTKIIESMIGFGPRELKEAYNELKDTSPTEVIVQTEHCVSCFANHSWSVVSHWELPVWLRDNDFLWHSHRPQIPSIKQCFISMFRVHTETGNIWTHFVGMLLWCLAIAVVLHKGAVRGYLEHVVFGTYFVGCTFCLMFSWLFHTCACHSEKASSLLSKLDYTGISLVITGGVVPCIYFGFYCNFYEKIIYTSILVALGLSCIIVSFVPRFGTPKFRAVRAGLFISLGLSLLIPCTHMVIMHGFRVAVHQSALEWLLIMAVSVIGGGVIYAARVPERFFPGKCNIMFQSHQIFHVLVVIGAFLHLHGCIEMADFRFGRNCSAIY